MLVSVFLLSNINAQVGLPATDHQPMGACKQDIATLCADAVASKHGVKECLQKNKEKLSAECSAQITELKGKVKEMNETCKADVEKFCASVEKGKGRIVKCLKENKDKEGFGAECKAELESMKKLKKKWKD